MCRKEGKYIDRNISKANGMILSDSELDKVTSHHHKHLADGVAFTLKFCAESQTAADIMSSPERTLIRRE